MLRTHSIPWKWSCATTTRPSTIFHALRARSAIWTGRISRIRFDDTRDLRSFVYRSWDLTTLRSRLSMTTCIALERSRALRSLSAPFRVFSNFRWRFPLGSRPAKCAGLSEPTPQAATCIPRKAICSSAKSRAFRQPQVFITTRPWSMRWSCGQRCRRKASIRSCKGSPPTPSLSALPR